jgi:membrane dipeptidase
MRGLRSVPIADAPVITRRDVLRGMAGLGLLALSGRATHAQSGPELLAADPALARLAAGIIGVDMHSHSGGVHFRRVPQYDIAERMRQGRLTAICLSHTGDGPILRREPNGKIVVKYFPAPDELYRHTLERLNFFDTLVHDQGFRRMLKPGDLEAAHKAGVPAIVQAIEGCQFLEGKLERVGEVHRRGVRHLQMVHFFRSELGDNQTEPPGQGGLTAFGREMIAECNRLGMVVDVAHGTMEFVEQAAKACRTPLVLSHAPISARTPAPLSRAVSPQHAKLVAQTGGVLGLWTIVGSFRSLNDWVDGVARMADTVGPDHVGLGSDIGGASKNHFTDYRDFPLLLKLLRERGFSPEEIGKIAGGNYVRVFNRSTGPGTP